MVGLDRRCYGMRDRWCAPAVFDMTPSLSLPDPSRVKVF